MPKSSYGKGSVVFVFLMFICFVITTILANHINESELNEDTINAYFIKIEILNKMYSGIFVAGISAFCTGLVSIFDQKDRGFLVIISTIFGAACTVYFILDRLFIH
jgi:hypothetical protein